MNTSHITTKQRRPATDTEKRGTRGDAVRHVAVIRFSGSRFELLPVEATAGRMPRDGRS